MFPVISIVVQYVTVYNPPPLQVLLWFSRSDSRSKVLCRACTRLQLNYEAVYSQERAMEVFSAVSPQLVIIDQRNSKPVTGAPAL